MSEAVGQYIRRGIMSKARTRAQIEDFFTGFELIKPGVVPVHRWRPDDQALLMEDSMVSMYGGLAVEPCPLGDTTTVPRSRRRRRADHRRSPGRVG
ncbi:SAM-dependent methyltransferase [Nonomuraea sp. NPDC049758]|uniref:SAM-dependent methyltransferase n=1 Tax=Nonomuraea sp. NPDC049758 TaxID=3154360 RepID=UPI00341409B7